jgi:hypothetical protein
MEETNVKLPAKTIEPGLLMLPVNPVQFIVFAKRPDVILTVTVPEAAVKYTSSAAVGTG